MASVKRKQLMIDPAVQGALVSRAVSYWIMCLLTLSIFVLVWQMITNPGQLLVTYFRDLWFNFGPALVASALLLPIVLFDTVKQSNRFAGPLWRMRSGLRALARGERVAPLKFRDNDFWHEVADEFNAVLNRFEAVDLAERKEDASEQSGRTPSLAGSGA